MIVARNPQYERQLAALQGQLKALHAHMLLLKGATEDLAEAIENLQAQIYAITDPVARMPHLPVIKGRMFGKGRKE